MKKIITTAAFGVAAAALIVGCGGGSGSTPQTPRSDIQKGVGYYLDSAVVGADYICGTLEGVTQKDGKFFFEKGKDCKFLVAGIPLRNVPANRLSDNAKIVEDNLTVAMFLQSIDNDGNASNGIEINEKVSKTLKTVFKEKGIKEVPHDNLDVVVDQIKQHVDSFKGEVKDIDTVREHLTQTQAQVLKEFLSGKTVYTKIDGKEGSLESWSFGDSFDTIVWKELVGGNDTDTSTISDVTGSSFIVTDSDSSAKLTVMEQHGDYIFVNIHMLSGNGNDEILKVYFDKDKAETAFGIKQAANSPKALLSGKTVYTTIDDKRGTLESWTFDASFSQITWKELVGGSDVDISRISDTTDSSFVATDNDSSAKLTLLERHDDYLLVSIHMLYGGGTDGTLKVYFDKIKAETAFGINNETGGSNGGSSTAKPDLSGRNVIHIMYNVNPTYANTYLAGYSDYDHYTSQNISSSIHCSDYGFDGGDSNIRVTSIPQLHNVKYTNKTTGESCDETDYTEINSANGSSNVIFAYYLQAIDDSYNK